MSKDYVHQLLKVKEERHDNDHIYLNYTVVNKNTTKDGYTIAKFTDTRSTPFITDTANYHVTISRFGIPSTDIPIFVFPPNPIPGTALNYFVVTLNFGGVDYQSTAVPIVNTYNTTGNAYIYYVEQFLESLNNAWTAATTALLAANPALAPLAAPFYTYNQQTSLISINFDLKFLTNAVDCWVSWEIANKISGIYAFFNGYYNADYHDHRYNIKDYGNNRYTYNGTTYINLTQEGSQLGNMMDLQTIVFLSDLPTKSENTGILNAMGSSGGESTSTSSPNLKILLDFEPVQGFGFQTTISAQRFQYQPSLYRLVDLVGSDPINSITLQMYWEDNRGVLVPIIISPGRSFNVKILFVKKGQAS